MREVAPAMTRHRAASVASPGLARGTLWFARESGPVALVGTQSPAEALEGALERARIELAQLQSGTGDADADAMLEFQIAMLEDETVLGPAWQAIADGTPAAAAWRVAIEAQLAEYVDAEDPYFRARSADLRDMRDRVLRCLSGQEVPRIPAGSIVLARDLAPSLFLETEWHGGGIALIEGSTRSHVAMLARARGVPLLIGVDAVAPVAPQALALLDGERGELVIAPDAGTIQEFTARMASAVAPAPRQPGALALPARTRDGATVKLLINVADGSELSGIPVSECDGVGLVRTELLLRSTALLGDEERQFDAYRRMVSWAAGRPVTIRTLDAGADKPIAGYTLEEANPFLGTRGVRLSLAVPGPLRIQLRALARAAAAGPLRVMVPMVTLPSELEAVRALLETALGELKAEGRAHARPQLGMMVEVPLAALALDDFRADFFSIGSNDLIQYLCAASRDSGRLATLQDPLHPAVLDLIGRVVKSAAARGIDVSLCGDMASEPRCVAALLRTGLRALSVAPGARAAVHEAISAFTSDLTEPATN